MNLPEPSTPPGPAPEAAGPGRLRASDADRDRVADRLREALAEGRITPEEHAERIDVVYQAKTYAELEPVLADLPGATGDAAAEPSVSLRKDEAPLPAPASMSPSIVAIFSGAERKGRWLVEPTTTLSCVFGGAELDFRQAVLSQREVTLSVSCVFGGVEIDVPPGVRVVNSVTAVFGDVSLPGGEGFTDPDAPVIRLTGFVLFGGVSVKRDAPRPDRATRRRERHELHQRRREERHELHRRHREERRDRS